MFARSCKRGIGDQYLGLISHRDMAGFRLNFLPAKIGPQFENVTLAVDR